MASFSFGSLLQMPVRLTVITQDLTCTLFRASDPRSEVTCQAQVCRQKTAKSQKERLANMHAMRSVPASPHHNKPNAETEHWISRLQLQLKIAQFFSKVLYADVAVHTTAVLSCGSCVFLACPNLNLLSSRNFTVLDFFLNTPYYFHSGFL